MGPAFLNIPVGENVAYFPGISFSKNEVVNFNFGGSPLVYSYDGYQQLDIPEAYANGSLEITKEFVNVLKRNVLKILCLQNVSCTNK